MMPGYSQPASASNASVRMADLPNTEETRGEEESQRLYVLRELYMEYCNRFIDEINDEERFQALDSHALRVRKERLQGHFDKMESAHTSYRQRYILANDEVYVELETKFMRAMSKIDEKLNENRSDQSGSAISTEALMPMFDHYAVIHGVLRPMYAAEYTPYETYSVLRAAVDSIVSTTRQLETIATVKTQRDQLFIHHWMQRLPLNTSYAWEEQRNQLNTNVVATLEDFRKFLETRSEYFREFESRASYVMESTSDGGKIKPEIKSSRPKSYDEKQHENAKNTNAVKNKSVRPGFVFPSRCVMPNCDRRHFLGQCDHFYSLTLTDRLGVVKKNRLCRCCFLSGHIAASCQRLQLSCWKCPNDKAKHHFSVCTQSTFNTTPAVAQI